MELISSADFSLPNAIVKLSWACARRRFNGQKAAASKPSVMTTMRERGRKRKSCKIIEKTQRPAVLEIRFEVVLLTSLFKNQIDVPMRAR